jgi:CBS domain containing-hemolysin-like protein
MDELQGVISLITVVFIPFFIGVFTRSKSIIFSILSGIVSVFILIVFFEVFYGEIGTSSFFYVAMFYASVISVFASWAGRSVGRFLFKTNT